MKARRNRFASRGAVPTIGAAALLLAALVAMIGSAQAAPSTKLYDATVHVTNGQVSSSSATLTLTLTNDTRGKQGIGSANFTPPAGIEPTAVVRAADRTGWVAGIDGGAVTFRSTTALTPGQSVSADVQVSIGSCTNATWTTRAKQSNDFSGQPGNDAAINAARSNLRPLGSFDFAPIGTQLSPEIFAPQIRVSIVSPISLTAFDLCGAMHTGYGSGFGDSTSLEAFDDTPDRLVGADISTVAWTSGAGSATVEPVVVETGDKLVASDGPSAISATSDEFDVVEKICTSLDTTCTWQDRPTNPRILAHAAAPPAGAAGQPDPNLGIGFNDDLTFACAGDTTPVGGTLVNINPRDYPAGAAVTITLTYGKSITGNGPASSFDVCLSKDNGLTWGDPLGACPSDAPALGDAPCILERKRTTGGDLEVVLFLEAVDPWTGLG